LAFSSKVVEIVGVVVSRTGADPITSIVAVADLTSNVIFSVSVRFKSTLNPLTVVVAKFGAVAEISYTPGGRLPKRYSPAPLTVLVYFPPVSTFRAVTVALGTAARFCLVLFR